MDKKALMDYALYSRKELETQIALSLNKLGIYKDHHAKCNIVGERTVIEGVEQTFPKNVYELRNRIISEHIGVDGFDVVVEEFAYTWFNRIIALRFMEVHDYFPHGFRVLTARGGGYEPEILRNLSYVAADLELDMAKVDSYKSTGDNDELYRYVLFSQCNALSEILPMLFDRQQEYMELLLPHNLLSQNSVIRRIVDIPEEDFLNDVEVIGWLYQFYNSVKKDEVFASKKTITKDTLPAVTQLFTPDWIVRYMAQNSVGRIWLESYPNSPLKSAMKYYVEDAQQEADVLAKLERIKYKNVNPEELRIIEPCCGSGHILVYVFDLLYEMYLEKGYNRRDIPRLILKNNLYGLDVDKRAAQLSQFSLMMKARSIDPRFFNKDRIVVPNVYEIIDSKPFGRTNYIEEIKGFRFSKYSADTLEYLISTFNNGKVIGSLLKVQEKDYERVRLEIEDKIANFIADTTQMDFQLHLLPIAEKLCKIAAVLSAKYDVMITNPPYIGVSSLEQGARDYANKYYPCSKVDMFAMFMETEFVKKYGFTAMINMRSWMFLGSFEQLRSSLLKTRIFENLIYLGPHAFEAIGGEVVQTVSFVLRAASIDGYRTSFQNLESFDSQDKKEQAFLSNSCISSNQLAKLENIPGKPLAFWLNETFLNIFLLPPLRNSYEAGNGITTGENERFIRFWYEVKPNKEKWYPCNKGGSFRRWYGNQSLVIDWEEDGRAIKTFVDSKGKPRATLRNIKYALEECITMSRIVTGTTSFRYLPQGFISESSTNNLFVNSSNPQFYGLLGYLNSSLADYILKIYNPTINVMPDDIRNLPSPPDLENERLRETVIQCIEICREDWDSRETSWNFQKHPLIKYTPSDDQILLSEVVEEQRKIQAEKIVLLAQNEEEIDSFFKLSCDCQTISLPKDNQSTIQQSSQADLIKSLISYCIGLLMGRYSLTRGGVVCSGGVFDQSQCGDYTDEDGVLHIYRFAGMNDGLTLAIVNLLARIYGNQTLEKNLAFIANVLNPESAKGPRETLNDYLNNSYYEDHLKLYQKRPIYWMMSSGKRGAFRCLVYMHRYNKNTLALINSKYFLPRTAMYKAERERLQGRIDSGLLDTRELKEVRKQLDEVLACEQELLEYGQVLDHMANQYIDIDLDDGVKVNYAKFQGVELEVDGRTIKKDLFVPIK